MLVWVQHILYSRSNSSRWPHAVSSSSLLHSRPALHAAATPSSPSMCQCAASNSSRLPANSGGTVGRVTATGVICRDAPRPMWAKGPAPGTSGRGNDGVGAMITRAIVACDSIVALSDVYDDWGARFDYIQASAALVKYSKLSRRGYDEGLLSKLARTWLKILPDAGARACANVLWSCSSMGRQQRQLSALWEPTWHAYLRHVGKAKGQAGDHPGEALLPQHISSSLWAAAKLRKLPDAADLQLLVQSFLRASVLAKADSQAIANVAWAVGKLCQLPGWQGGISEQDMRQLVGKEQLQLVADSGNEQAISNLLVALVGISAGKAPLISKAAAQEAALQLLSVASGQLRKWIPQHITNAMWVCSELELADLQFMSAAVKAASAWVPRSTGYNLTQAATACALMGYRDQAFLRQGHGQVLSASDKASIASLCSISVTKHDIFDLAEAARQLVASCGVVSRLDTHPANLRHLWVFHSWLLQHQLLDGNGLSGVLTQQQLQQGESDVAVYGDGIKSAA